MSDSLKGRSNVYIFKDNRVVLIFNDDLDVAFRQEMGRY